MRICRIQTLLTLSACTCKPWGCASSGIDSPVQQNRGCRLIGLFDEPALACSDSLTEPAVFLRTHPPSPPQAVVPPQLFGAWRTGGVIPSPPPPADPQKPHGKHQGCVLRRDPRNRSRSEGFFPPYVLLSFCLQTNLTSFVPPSHPAPSFPFPLCRVRPFPEADLILAEISTSAPVPALVIDVFSAPLPPRQPSSPLPPFKPPS